MALTEQKYMEIADFVNNLEIEDSSFRINGTDYNLLMCPTRDYRGNFNDSPIGWVARSGDYSEDEGTCSITSADIYIWESLHNSVQKVLIFHELVEIHHVPRMTTTEAHEKTIPWEQRYISENLGLKDQKRVELFTNWARTYFK